MVAVAAIVYNLPRFFERRVVIDTCQGVSLPRTEKTELRESRDYFLVYKTACYFIFRAVGPLVALIVLNAELISALRAVRRRRRRLLVHKSNERGAGRNGGGENLTLMLITVVTVFIVCQLPNLGIRIAFTANVFAPPGAVQLNIESLRYANVASNALLILNSAINFAIYCLVGKKFRRIFVREVATCNGRQKTSASDEGESVTIRQGSLAATELSRSAAVDLDGMQMTELRQQRSPKHCGRTKSAVDRRRKQQNATQSLIDVNNRFAKQNCLSVEGRPPTKACT